MNASLLTQDISKDLNLDALSEEERASALEEIGQVVIEGMVTRVVATMDESEAGELDTFLSDERTPEELIAFLKTKEPNLDTILKEEIEAFKKEATQGT